MAIPINLYEHPADPVDPWGWGSHTFTGLYVYRAGINNGFEFLGRIKTSDQPYYSYNSWLRGIFTGTNVYAVQPDAVRSADIDDIASTINTLYLEPTP